jgi:hypothetical protein
MDIDLMRAILVKGEELPPGAHNIEIDGYTPEEISFQIQLLRDDGLVEALNCANLQTPCCWLFQRMTASGYRFLADARNDSVWQKAKAFILKAGSALTIEAMKIAITEVLKG